MSDVEFKDWKSLWHDIFRLMSLDCLVPEWSNMGLELEIDERDFVIHASRVSYLVYQDGATNHYDANFSKAEQAVNIFCESLIAFREIPLRDRIVNWCRQVFVEALEGTIEREWFLSFIKLRNNLPGSRSYLELSEDKSRYLNQIIEDYLIIPNERLDSFLEDPENEIKSDWDKFIHGGSMAPEWAETELEEELFLPALHAKTLLKYVSLLRLWDTLIKRFAEADMKSLYEWYEHMIKEKVKYMPEIRGLPFEAKAKGQNQDTS